MLTHVLSSFKILALVVFLIDFLFYVLPSRQGRWCKALWTVFIAAACCKFVVFTRWGGHAFNPVLPAFVQLAWGWAYLGASILSVLVWPAFFWRKRRFMAWALPSAAFLLALTGLANCLRLPSVKEIELSFPDLPAELEGYRIVQLSDLHASTAFRAWRTEAVVRLVNAARPDIICLTGDLRDGSFDAVADDVRPLENLHARDGVWAVTGNHEYYMPPAEFEKWSAFYAVCGIRFLENRCVFPHPGLALGGVSDVQITSKRCRIKGPVPDVRQAFAVATNGEFRVLLEHRPVNARANLGEVGVRLQLSGHTHGGILPGFDRIVARSNRGFVKGIYRLGSGVLVVSSGVGQWAGFPIRLFNDSEIDLIVLRRK